MPRLELVIVALVYIALLVLGQRAVGAIFPAAQDIGFAVAAVGGAVTAGLLHRRRTREPATARVKFSAGLLMALLAAGVGWATYVLWYSTLRPLVTLPVAAVATFAAPWLIFPLLRRFRDETALRGAAATPIGEPHVAGAAVVAAVLLVVAYFIPVPGRSPVRLVGKTYPSLFIGLPEWEAEQHAATMEFGSIRLKDPRGHAAGSAGGGGSAGGDKFIALRWIDADPVQADEHVQTIAVGGLAVRDRFPAFVSRHQGTTFYLESDDHLTRAAATIWNCPQDHRVLWIFSHLAGSKNSMLATHEKILKNVRCHTGRNKDAVVVGSGTGGAGGAGGAGSAGGVSGAAATQKIFPSFAPPPGFVRAMDVPAGAGLVFIGPADAEIVFDAALPGRSDIVREQVSADIIAKLLTQAGILQRVEGAPALTTVNDLHGHARRVWSVAGVTPSRRAVQMELMIWHCDKRNLTFIGRYATPARHDARLGVDALLPAACHAAE